MQDSCMQKNVQATLRLAETNNSQLTRPAVFSGVSVGSFPEQRLIIEPSPTPGVPLVSERSSWFAVSIIPNLSNF